MEEFIEASGFFVDSEEESRRVAARLLEQFTVRLLFRLAERKSGYPVARMASELAGVRDLLDSRLPEFQIPIGADHVEEAPTSQSKVHHHRVSLARDLIKEGHAKAARSRLVEIRGELRTVPSSSELRFRIAMNLGVCALELGDLAQAESEFNSALAELPDDPKALANLSLVFILKGDPNGAVNLAQRAHTLSPRDQHTTSVLVISLARAGDFERLDALLESDARISTDPGIAFALGQAFSERGDYQRAAVLFEAAIGVDGADGPAHLWLGTVLFRGVQARVLADRPLPSRIGPHDRALLERAESLLSRAADLSLSHDNPERRYTALTNRAGVRSFLGRQEEALADCNLALALGPPRDETLANKGRLLLQLDRPREAIAALAEIAEPIERIATAPLLASAYPRSGKPSKVVAILEASRKRDGTSDQDIMIAEQLMLAYDALDEPAKAESVIAELQAAMPSHLGVALVLAQRLRSRGRPEEAISTLRAAASEATGGRTDWIKLQLAELYQEVGRDSEAAELYDQLVDITSHTETKARYVVSLFNARRYGDALKRAQQFRNLGPVLPVISEIESLVLERAGDLASAVEIMDRLFEEAPATATQLVRLASLNLRLGDSKRAIQDTRRISFDAIKNDVDLLLQTAGLYISLGLPGELPLLYQARRVAPGRADAHLGFVGAFLQTPSDDPVLTTPIVVAVDVAVSLRRDGEEKTYIILEEAIASRENELSASDELARRLIGTREGDTVLLSEGTVETVECEIVRVATKFVAAAQDTLNNFGVRFPGNTDIQSVSAPAGDISKMLAVVDTRHAAITGILEEYRRIAFPLGLLADRTGFGSFRTWAVLVSDPTQVLLVSTGSAQDLFREAEILKGAKRLALDLSALFTIRFLDLENTLLARFELVTNQLLADSLIEARAREETSPGPHMMIGKEGDQYVRTDVPAEAGDRAIAFLLAALAFLRENATFVKVLSLLEGRSARRELVEKAIGTSAFAAVLLAREQSIPLFADDLGLRQIAHAEFGVTSVTIQSVLLALRESGSLTAEAYHAAVAKLVTAGYRHIVVEAETILVALRQGHMEISPRVVSLCRVLEGPDTTLDSAVQVAAEILKGSALEALTDQERDLLLDLVLRSLITGRLAELVIPKLIGAVRQRFKLLPVHLAKVLGGIRLWASQHLDGQAH